MRSFAVRSLLFCLMPGLIFSVSSCSFDLTSGTVEPRPAGGPPKHAPAHGRRRRAYVYYPSSRVYFDSTRKVYFYMTGSTWRTSVRLPSSITVDLREGVSMTLDTDRPYTYFSTHKKKYPPGHIKKTQKGKGRGKGKGKKK